MKLIASIAAFFLLTANVMAADYMFVKTGGGDNSTIGTIMNEDGLAYDRIGYVFPDTYNGDMISAVVNYSSVTFADVTFSTDAISMGSGLIIADSHGLQTGVAVKLEETDGTVPEPLVAETTYYAYRNSAGVVSIATTSAQAIANDPIVFISSTTDGSTQLYTLVAVPYSGTPSFKWQASNDGSKWFDLNTPSVTMSSPNEATTAWDFEWLPFSGLRLNVTAPDTGAIKIKAYGYIRQ